MTGLSRSTWHYRHKPRPPATAPILQRERRSPSRISGADRQQVEQLILAGWAKDLSVDHSFASAWDDGLMLGSRRTWWRIAAELEEQLRPKIPTGKGPAPRQKPVVAATAPGQAWSWDITDLLSPFRGVTFKAYKITDIYSREIIAHRIEHRECDALAVEMFEKAIAERGAPTIVHADSGPAMRSTALRVALDAHGITLSHNRPYVSNDNPFSEAGFRTMKYRPGYPKIFQDIDHARTYLAGYVDWYNTSHRHSGIALFTPQQVGDGSWRTVWAARDTALQAYYDRHPERFHARPTTPAPAHLVGINLTKPHRLTTA